MKKISIACNICGMVEDEITEKIHGIDFTDGGASMGFIVPNTDADMHICQVCLACIENLRTNKR